MSDSCAQKLAIDTSGENLKEIISKYASMTIIDWFLKTMIEIVLNFRDFFVSNYDIVPDNVDEISVSKIKWRE